MNKADLLGELHIKRGPSPTSSSGPPPWVWLAGLGAVLALAALIAFLVLRPDRITVQAAPVRQASAADATGSALLEASGYVVARRQATVSSKIIGRVDQVLIEDGQHVRAGQVIARLDPSNVRASLAQAMAGARAAEANLKVAEVAESNAGPKYQRNKRLNEQGWLSEQAVEDSLAAYDNARYQVVASRRSLEVAQAQVQVNARSLDDTVVRAPFDGVVTEKVAQPGEIVAPSSAGGGFTRTGIGTIVDMSSLEVEVDVSENQVSRVHAGMPATVRLNAYPDWEIPAVVEAVIPTADRSKATVKVRVSFQQLDPRIVPEMGARVAFLSAPLQAQALSARATTVPAAAVKAEDSTHGVVFVLDGSRLERRAVRLGPRSGDDQQVAGGLRAGEEVALGDLSKFHDGMTVHVKAAAGS